MTDLRAAAEQALEALEAKGAEWVVLERKARIALRQALAEKQECETCAAKRKKLTEAGLLKSPLRGIDGETNYEPVVFTNINSVDLLIGKNEVMRVTGDGIAFSDRVDPIDTLESYVDKNEKREHEPVAWMQADQAEVYVKEFKDEVRGYTIPLYTAPLSKPWVSLSDRDITGAARGMALGCGVRDRSEAID